jgi:GT2 family glycosyltransferase/SAM-dependent methyltransferase
MDFTGERFVPEVEGDIKLEHVHRYLAVRELVAGKRVLDIACGEGYGSKIMAEYAASVVGVDVDDASVVHAQAAYADERISFLHGDIVAIPLADAAVDVVVSFETLEHLADHRTMMQEIRRVLAPGGVLVMSSPDKREYSDVPNYKNPYHVRELYQSEFCTLLEANFAHYALYGQRVHYASVLAPAAGRLTKFIGYREADDGGVVEGDGLPNAVYLLAVASDAELPALPCGVFIPKVPPYFRDLGFLQKELDERGRAILQLESKLSVAGNEVDTFKARLREADEQTAAMRRQFAEAAESTRLERENWQAQLAAAQAQIHAMYNSTSWKFARPVRAASKVLRALRPVAAKGLRVSMKAVPLDAKIRMREAIFSRSGRVFARTGAYKRWRDEKSPPPPAYDIAAAGPSWSAEFLDRADGAWEWAGHGVMRARIGQVHLRRRAALRYVPRQLITISEQTLADAARAIALPDPGGAPTISVIVPVFNELKTTIECLLSIAAAKDGPAFEVILANDASTDETADVLGTVPHLVLANQEHNVGFLRNCNNAARRARGKILVILNNDTQVFPGWLAAFAAALDEPGVGAVGPKIVYPNGALQEAGNRIVRAGAVEMIGLNDAAENPRWGYARDVEYVSGACLALKRSLFEELGGFCDELAPAYCEDLELSLRIRSKGLRIRYVPEVEICHHLSVSSASQPGSYKYALIAKNMQWLSEHYQANFDALDDVRIIAFYLPQFHPIPENDLWWGTGFTEWQNVAKAVPNFVGHDQPRIPADLGFYDLRMAEVMEAQWKLAAQYGIDGFCYYYYWFHGHRLLGKPLVRLLDFSAPAHPFCLCWANENWTRRWDGKESEILMAQHHSPEDDVAVLRDMAKYMENPAYIRILGMPVVVVYRVDLFPDFSATAARWREEFARQNGGKLYIVMVDSFRFAGHGVNPQKFGCDASLEFPAHYLPDTKKPEGAVLNANYAGEIGAYDDAAARFATREHPGYPRFRTVMPGWDNTPRRQDASFILENPTPGVFQAWLEAAIAETKRDFCGDERLVFINAWNEWGEGAYLEPDKRFGHAWLQAVKNARDAEFLLRDDG